MEQDLDVARGFIEARGVPHVELAQIEALQALEWRPARGICERADGSAHLMTALQ